MKQILLILSLTVFYMQAYAQSIKLHEIYATQPFMLTRPAMINPVDRYDKQFTDESLLKSNLSIPEQASFTIKYAADTAGFFNIPAQKGTHVQLYSFYVSAGSYGKARVKVTSPNMLEVYINNKPATSKTTTEGSNNEAKSVTADFEPYPQTCRIVIKSLCTEDTETSLKIELEDVMHLEDNRLQVSEKPQSKMILDDMIKGKRVSGISVSPSGKHVLITYIDNHGAQSFYSKELYTIQSGKRVSIDTDNRKRQLDWMPKSDRMYFLQKDGEYTNLITINPETLEETILTRNIPNEQILFSPDEKAVFYSKAAKVETAAKDDVFKLHTLTNRAGGIPPHPFIYRHNLETGLTQQLTFGSHGTSLNDISNDGKKILFSVSEETITERPFRKSSMYILDIESMHVDTIWKGEKFVSRATFSPDGESILTLGGAEAFNGASLNISNGKTANSYDTQAFLINLKTKDIDPITKDFNPSIKSMIWNAQDGLIYFLTTDEDRVPVYTYNIKSRKFTRLPSEEDVISSFQIASKASVMVYSGVSVSNSTRAYIYDLKTKRATVIADPYADRLAQLKIGEVRDFDFINSDNVNIKGCYYLPPDFDPSKKYPLIVNYYGGTTPTERIFESRYPKHVYAALGYVVYVVQPSGAIGFGQDFSALHVNTWGEHSSDDIIEGTEKFIAEHSFIDAKRIGCIGASYGGFMTMYLQTKTDLFAAAVSHAGISSISSYWGEGYWGYSYSSAASAHSYPWNNPDMYINQSPLFSADKINTPILLIHGASDTNVPVGESIQMYTALKILGRPAELVQVKGEDHHILTYEKRLKWNNTIFAWFDRWLKNEPLWWNELYK